MQPTQMEIKPSPPMAVGRQLRRMWMVFTLRDIPKYEALRARVRRYPEIDPIAVETFLVLLRVASDVMTGAEDYWTKHGLSHGRFIVLAVLNRDPSIALSPSDLADKCGVSRATMTGLVAGLQRHHYVRREHHHDDRRMALVRLTPEGVRFLDAILPDYYRRLARMMGYLDQAEKRKLEEMLVKIGQGLPEMTGE
ncbi:MAG TPA: MarR family transcriptional regulator [Tepidisphaeraceae bacterium]|nr:MarR family transcriptional regulator [Tepidisphaeraceae bacterium]